MSITRYDDKKVMDIMKDIIYRVMHVYFQTENMSDIIGELHQNQIMVTFPHGNRYVINPKNGGFNSFSNSAIASITLSSVIFYSQNYERSKTSSGWSFFQSSMDSYSSVVLGPGRAAGPSSFFKLQFVPPKFRIIILFQITSCPPKSWIIMRPRM